MTRLSRQTHRALAPLVIGRKGYYTELAEWASSRGYTTLRVDGVATPTDRWPRLDRFKEHTSSCRSPRSTSSPRRSASSPTRSRARSRSATTWSACSSCARTPQASRPRRRNCAPPARASRTRRAARGDAPPPRSASAASRARGGRRIAAQAAAETDAEGELFHRARVHELRPELRAARSAALLVQLALRLVPRAASAPASSSTGFDGEQTRRGVAVARDGSASPSLRGVRGHAPEPEALAVTLRGPRHRASSRRCR